MYDISNEYRNYLRKFDCRVSKKSDRKFYGILVTKNKIDYYIPLTSKISKKTSSKLTVNIYNHRNKLIAKLLLNNMIPVNITDSKVVDISKSKYRDYYNSEIEYLRKEKVKIQVINKIDYIFYVLNDKNHVDYKFFKTLCCDFRLLEQKNKEWINKTNKDKVSI